MRPVTKTVQYFAKSSARFTNADAQVIGPVLSSLAERGPVTARDVVEAAHSSNSPIHEYFEWDDKKAADMHRVGVARDMVKTVRVRIVQSDHSERGYAAQKITLRPAPSPSVPQMQTTIARSFDPDERKRDLLTKHSLDADYYPDDLDEACDIIAALREMLSAFTNTADTEGSEYGMTGKESALYRFLKAKKGAVATKEQILTAIYGVADDMPEIKIVDVFVCKMRKKLPAGEEVQTVWGQGYRWVMAANAADSPKRRFEDHPELDPENVLALPANNPAVIEGRTLFPSTVVNPKDSPALLVSGQNSRKLGSHVTKGPWKGFPIYQLSLEERATCPRSCFHWRSCYGNSMQLARRHRNTPDLTDYLRAELLDLQDEFPRGFVVRLHVLGDFYSEEYARQWVRWLAEFPALHVFGYTAHSKESLIGSILYHATKAEWSNERVRFAIRFSSQEPQPQGATTIWRMPKDDKVREGIVCPAQTGKVSCCAACGLCWNVNAKDESIAFIAHGRTSRRAA